MATNDKQMNNLVSLGIVEDYPPLVDKKGSYTAQWEHVSQSTAIKIEHILMIFRRSCSVQIARRLLAEGMIIKSFASVENGVCIAY